MIDNDTQNKLFKTNGIVKIKPNGSSERFNKIWQHVLITGINCNTHEIICVENKFNDCYLYFYNGKIVNVENMNIRCNNETENHKLFKKEMNKSFTCNNCSKNQPFQDFLVSYYCYKCNFAICKFCANEYVLAQYTKQQ